MSGPSEHTSLVRFARLSIAAAVVTISMKAGAYLLTGSVGLLSDAPESVVNLVAVIVALVAVSVAPREPDEERASGYQKAE
jgi:divalent metal cation (Fe/Co/Zn/Cd) transporter